MACPTLQLEAQLVFHNKRAQCNRDQGQYTVRRDTMAQGQHSSYLYAAVTVATTARVPVGEPKTSLL